MSSLTSYLQHCYSKIFYPERQKIIANRIHGAQLEPTDPIKNKENTKKWTRIHKTLNFQVSILSPFYKVLVTVCRHMTWNVWYHYYKAMTECFLKRNTNFHSTHSSLFLSSLKAAKRTMTLLIVSLVFAVISLT